MKNILLILSVWVSVSAFAQNVGIGTNAPGSKTSINGNLSVGSSYSGVAAPTNGAIIEGPVGVGTSAPNSKLDVIGDISFREGPAISLSNGTNNNVDASTNKYSFYRITGPTAAFSITGITGGQDGRVITLYNTTSFAATISNQDASSTAANRIKTLDGGNLVSLDASSTITLNYNTTEQRWIVTGQQNYYPKAGWSLRGNASTNPSNDFIGTTDGQDVVIRTTNTEKVRITSGGNVGIGVSPNASALLDVSASNKGISFPNVLLTSSTDNVTIASPKLGLLVYNPGTGGLSPAGIYINTSATPTSPVWVRLSDASTVVTGVGVVAPLQSTGGLSPTLSMPQANSGTDGYLDNTDWTTFNSKLGTALGDGNIWVGSSGGVATQRTPGGDLLMSNLGNYTLNTVNSNTGVWGSATQVPQFTVNGKGLVTAAANVTISGTAPGGTASGDLSGSYPGPTVAKINGATLGSTTATDKNILIANGSTWVSRSISGDATISNTGAVTLTTVNTITPGTYGSATAVPVITVNGKGLVTASSSTTITGTTPGGTASGDLSGTYPSPTVDALQGVPVSATAPTTTNNVLTWNGTAWAPANKGVPTGVIVMWSGAAAAIPGGWQICDGTNGTPNLLDKFVLSVPASAYTVGQINQTGGSSSVTLTTTQLPAHTHTGTSDATQPTFTGTANQTTSSVTPTFTGTANQTTNSVTPTFTGTVNQSTSSVTPTFTGTANQTTNSVTPTFSGTANQSTSSVTPTFTGTVNQSTSSVTPTFAGTGGSTNSVTPTFSGAGGTTGGEASHTHPVNITTYYNGDHNHWLNTTTNYSGGGTRAFYGANAGGGNDGVTGTGGGHTHYVTGTSGAGSSHSHSFTPAGSISAISHTYTPAGTISAVQLTYTATGTVSAVQPTFTATGTISAVQHTYTATGAISAVQPTFTATGAISAVQHTYTATGTISTVGPLTYTATGTVSNHTHTFTTGSTGTGSAFSILPPYYTLAYIMKL